MKTGKPVGNKIHNSIFDKIQHAQTGNLDLSWTVETSVMSNIKARIFFDFYQRYRIKNSHISSQL